jgi:ribose 5-phosphate isomerase B
VHSVAPTIVARVSSSTDFSLWVSIGAWQKFVLERNVSFLWPVDLASRDHSRLVDKNPQTEVCATKWLRAPVRSVLIFMKPLITAADLERVPQNGELAITEDTLVTPLARDEAERRGITFRVASAQRPEPSSSAASGESAPEKSARIVAIGADHGGFELKQQLKGHLRDWGYQVLDLGTDSAEAVDYPDFAEAVGNAVARGDAWLGIVLDGAGIGSSIAANKVPGVRAALCYDRATARNSREHNDANVLTLGAKLIAPEAAREIVALWLSTPFAGGRHQRRVDKIRSIEERSAKK